jgi:hypothetical protein
LNDKKNNFEAIFVLDTAVNLMIIFAEVGTRCCSTPELKTQDIVSERNNAGARCNALSAIHMSIKSSIKGALLTGAVFVVDAAAKNAEKGSPLTSVWS